MKITKVDIYRPIDKSLVTCYNNNMKITKITASFSKKYQLRQFEPIEIFASAEAELTSEEAEDTKLLDRCYSNLVKLTKTQVENQLQQIVSGVVAPITREEIN